MRVVVTGATGNVGTSLVEALVADPDVDRIVGLARRRPNWSPPGVTWAQADVSRDDLSPHFRDAVVHVAWLLRPARRPDITEATNVRGSIRVFDAVAEAGVTRLVCASSVGAYSPAPKDRRIDETWPTDGFPSANHSQQKAAVERALDAFERRHPGIRIVRLRTAFIFKPEAAPQQRKLFAGPFLPSKLVGRRLVPVVPDLPGARFQVLHAVDAAEAYRLAITRPASGAFNIAAEPVVDGRFLADLLGARLVSLPVGLARAGLTALWRLHAVPTEPAMLDLLLRLPIMDTSRARTELGWAPRYDAADALASFLDGLKSGQGMDTPPLQPRTGGFLRRREAGSGVGQRPRPPTLGRGGSPRRPRRAR